MSVRLGWLAVMACMLALLPAQEQLHVEGPSPATLRLGDTSQIQLVVEGRGANPRAPELPQVDGLQLQVGGSSTQVYQSFDGRSQVQQYTVRYVVQLKPLREGSFEIPPIRIWTGSKYQLSQTLHLDVVKDMLGEEFGYLDVQVEPVRVYVHEPIRVRVEFGVDAGLRYVTDVVPGSRQRYIDYEVQASWLTDLDGAESLQVPDVKGGVPIVCNRSLQFADYDAEHLRGGRKYQSFVFERAFLPTRIGTFELAAPMLRYDVVLREGRLGIFGESVGAETKNYYVYGKPLKLEVLPIPEVGRPNPYYGAVGRFTVEAALDKDIVKLGGSFKLTFTVRGRGNLEFLRVPDLDALPGLHKLGQTEKRDSDSVQVTYDLAPLDAGLREVPAITWNYFDTTPGVEKFQSVATRPLPLTVKPLENGETLLPLPGAEDKPVTPGVDDIIDLRELTPGGEAVRQSPPAWLPWLMLLLPWLLVFGFTALRAARRRAAADVLGARARAAHRQLERALHDGVDAAAALAQYLGDRLGLPAAAAIGPDLAERLQAAGIDGELAARVAAALEAGTAARYGGGGGLAADTVRELVRQLEGVQLTVPRGALLLLAALLVAPLSAQDGKAGIDAYRRGDYPAAVQAFTQAIAHSPDRRLYFDLGNSYFRQGDLPHALWAYECARLGMPRDADLFANLRLVRSRLQLGDGAGEPFVQAVRQLTDYFTRTEQAWICGALQLAAALLLVLGWRSLLLRVLGLLVLLPGLALAFDLLWVQPNRPRAGIALQQLQITAEPRADAPVVAKVQPGVEVEIAGGDGGSWYAVRIEDRKGYAAGKAVAEVR